MVPTCCHVTSARITIYYSGKRAHCTALHEAITISATRRYAAMCARAIPRDLGLTNFDVRVAFAVAVAFAAQWQLICIRGVMYA